MTGYYDYVLGLIPAALIGTTLFLNLVGLSLTAALPVGAGIALALMLHAMFIKGPVINSADAPNGGTESGPAPSRSPASGGSD